MSDTLEQLEKICCVLVTRKQEIICPWMIKVTVVHVDNINLIYLKESSTGIDIGDIIYEITGGALVFGMSQQLIVFTCLYSDIDYETPRFRKT